MREIRQSGSEGGGTEFSRFSLPLFIFCPCRARNPDEFFEASEAGLYRKRGGFTRSKRAG
jgi:hypothetical protein